MRSNTLEFCSPWETIPSMTLMFPLQPQKPSSVSSPQSIDRSPCWTPSLWWIASCPMVFQAEHQISNLGQIQHGRHLLRHNRDPTPFFWEFTAGKDRKGQPVGTRWWLTFDAAHSPMSPHQVWYMFFFTMQATQRNNNTNLPRSQ